LQRMDWRCRATMVHSFGTPRLQSRWSYSVLSMHCTLRDMLRCHLVFCIKYQRICSKMNRLSFPETYTVPWYSYSTAAHVPPPHWLSCYPVGCISDWPPRCINQLPCKGPFFHWGNSGAQVASPVTFMQAYDKGPRLMLDLTGSVLIDLL
jgi:hypothetical protein